MSTITLYIRTLNNKTLNIEIDANVTVFELKDAIYNKYNIPIQTQQLFHHGHLLKDHRKLSAYKLDGKSCINQTLLLTQIFNIDVFISKKVLALYSLTDPKKSAESNNEEHPSQHSIDCNSSTTVNSILKELKLDHLSHLLKVCVGAGGSNKVVSCVDIRDMNKKIVDIPGLLSDGILSILFSARWFIDRTIDITNISSLMSSVIQQSTSSAKALKSCVTFNRLDYQFEKTQTFILQRFEEIDNELNRLTNKVNVTSKWFKKFVKDIDIKVDQDGDKLFHQLQKKVENIDATLKTVKRKWVKKRKQIILYLQKSVAETEESLMKVFRTWIASDIVQWLQYMDNRIIFGDDIMDKFVTANINGFNIADINDLTLKLMGIHDMEIRQLIIGYIDTLLTKYSDGKGSHSPYCHSPCCTSSDDSDHSNHSNKNVCCICTVNDVTTVIVPCGHATYCNDCSNESIKHSNQCPICRSPVTSIITVYKAGLQFSEH